MRGPPNYGTLGLGLGQTLPTGGLNYGAPLPLPIPPAIGTGGLFIGGLKGIY